MDASRRVKSPIRPTVCRRARSSLSYSSASSNCSRSSVAAWRMSSTLVWLANRSPSRLSSSAEIRASPSPTSAIASSMATSPSSRSTCRSACRRSRQPAGGSAGLRGPRLGRTIGCWSGSAIPGKLIIVGDPSMPHLDWPALWTNLLHLGTPDSASYPVSPLEKVVRPVVVYLILVFGLKTIGKRLLAQLNPFDFVVLLTLSNTVQNAIIGNDTSLAGGIVGAAALLGINALLVRVFYRGPSKALLFQTDKDIPL